MNLFVSSLHLTWSDGFSPPTIWFYHALWDNGIRLSVLGSYLNILVNWNKLQVILSRLETHVQIKQIANNFLFYSTFPTPFSFKITLWQCWTNFLLQYFWILMLLVSQYQHLFLYLSENVNSPPKFCAPKPEIKETKMTM